MLLKIIDTPQFQRLRYIKQMGGKYFVYPGASHNRFEHSIGVCYLAGEFVKTLAKNQEDLEISKSDILCVQIAGLCHDLGHGPFSHVFDSMVAPLLNDKNPWKHEDASVLMFEYLINKKLYGTDQSIRNELYSAGLNENDILFIKELILGCPLGSQHSNTDPRMHIYKGRSIEKWFLYEIVSNKFTSIDVDKWDYFARDCHGLGLSYDFDWKRYISICQVLYDCDLERKTICPKEKEATSLYDMFHAREMLHRKALQHVTCVSIELMIADALVSACEVMKREIGLDIKLAMIVANDQVTDSQLEEAMSTYELFTDTILQTAILIESKKQESEAGNILNRIYGRILYKFVGSVAEIPQMSDWRCDADRIKKTLIEYLATHKFSYPNDYEVYVATFDYGMKNSDPLNLLRTYRKHEDPPKARRLTPEETSRMLPRQFEEKRVRLYCKVPAKLEGMKCIFTTWSNDNSLSSTSEPNTPSNTPIKEDTPSRDQLTSPETRRNLQF